MGKGWGESRKHRFLNPSLFYKERWVLTPPSGGKQGPMAFLSEEKATKIATAIVNNHNVSVEIDHQLMNEDGEWISTPDE